MMTRCHMITIIIVAALLSIIAFFSDKAFSQKQWIVDGKGKGDYDTVQKAVNVAKDGDSIFVRSGKYNDTIIGKALFITGDKNVQIESVEVKANKVTLGNFHTKQIHSDSNIKSIILGDVSAPTINFDQNIKNIILENVNGSIVFTSDRNIKLNNVKGAITASNVADFVLQNYSGQLTGTTLQKVLVSNSNITGYNLSGKQISVRSSIGKGSVSGTDIAFASTAGSLTASASNIKIEFSNIPQLSITGNNITISSITAGISNLIVDNPSVPGFNIAGNNVTVSSSTLSGQIGLTGANVKLSNNNVFDYKATLAVRSSAVTSNSFLDGFYPFKKFLDATSFDISLTGNIWRNTFSHNTIDSLQGIQISSCDNNFNDNTVTRTFIPVGAYSEWKKEQEANQKAGLKVIGTCSASQGNHFSLNQINGFERGVVVTSDYNSFTVNQVESTRQDIKVSGNNNTILHNNFLFNGTGTDDGKGNRWFSLGPQLRGGNYWSKWYVVDNNGDGILDKPYALDGKGSSAVDMTPLRDAVPLLEVIAMPEFPTGGGIVVMIGIASLTGFFSLIRMRNRRKEKQKTLYG